MQQAPIIYLALGRKQEEFAVLDTKTYYKATPLIKTGQCTEMNKLISKTKRPEINPEIHGILIVNKSNSMRKECFT